MPAGASILVADDELNLRRVLDGDAAPRRLRGRQAAERRSRRSSGSADVDVVITDLRMPGADGMGCCARPSANYPTCRSS